MPSWPRPSHRLRRKTMTPADWQLLGCLVAVLMIIRLLYGRLVSFIIAGRPVLAAAMVVFVSPVMLALIITIGENRSLTDFTHLSHQPWSLIFGDTFVLSTAAAIAALSAPRWGVVVISTRWLYFCMFIGMMAGLGFHLMDVSNYKRLGTPNLTDAFSKVYHDGIVYPVLFGAFVLTTFLMIRYGRGKLRIAYLACVVVWVLLAARDATAGLNPRDFHTACNVACGLRNVNHHLSWLHSLVSSLAGLLASWRFV